MEPVNAMCEVHLDVNLNSPTVKHSVLRQRHLNMGKVIKILRNYCSFVKYHGILNKTHFMWEIHSGKFTSEMM